MYATLTHAVPRGVNASEAEKRFPTGGFKSLGHFAYVVHRSRDDSRAMASLKEWQLLCRKAPQGLFGDSDPDGGDLIPIEFSRSIYARMWDANAILPYLNPVPVLGRTYEWPVLKEDSRADGSRQGGLTGYWEGEADQHTKTKPQLRNIGLRLKKLAVFVYASDEVLTDAPALEAWLPQAAANELAFKTGIR